MRSQKDLKYRRNNLKLKERGLVEDFETGGDEVKMTGEKLTFSHLE